ncbi:MAG TPA: TonB family protein [Thermoanaerobaculia bacterium]|jgi:TonB family protein|nr:TonB family protein [Thermoanaerobaculia bacterium]
MSENILVVEYEPRYTDRVRQALTGQPFTPTFAKDGEEAIRALEGESPRLIVLSSVVPKVSTTELIRAIRGRKPLQETPILLTVSGYNGKSPKTDAQRVGASDILPKPYSEIEFLGKVQQMLGIRGDASQLTSNEIFGDLVDEDKPARRMSTSQATGNVDKMLADTLSGMMPKKRDTSTMPTQTGSVPVPPTPTPAPPPQQTGSGPQAAPKPKTASGDIDKRLQDTLSGLEKNARKATVTAPPTPSAPPPARPATPTAPGNTPAPAVAKDPRFNTERMNAYVPDRVPVAQPVFAPEPPPRIEEEEAEGTKFGQYALIEKIATGGMAEVWKARMRGVEGFQKTVAIKKILPHLSDNQDFIEMFVDEAKLAAQLNHNNIIHIYDLGKIQSSYYIAMEYIDGFDLKAILRRGQERDHSMTVELALFIASKLASALDYAHRKKDFEEKEMGLVHRDVSPQNVLVSQEGDIKLCDFGIAKAASKASHTQAGALKGKLQYMSPEQAWGRHIDRRSDIFALATVLFEMLTNRKLFTGDNELSILEQVREARVQPPSLYNEEVTPDIDKIVIKALQKDPANRYQTAGEMARDLDAILYSFRPTPTSADLAIYMHRLSSPDAVFDEPAPSSIPMDVPPPPTVIAPIPVLATPPARAAAVAAAPAAASHVAAATAAQTPEFGAYGGVPEPIKRKSNTGLIAAIVAVVLIGGAVAFFMTRKSGPAAAAATNTIAAASTTAAPLAATPLTATTATAGTTAATASIDPTAVDAEVQKRMAAERARMEAAARAQQQAAAQTTTAAPRPTPNPTPQVAQATPPPVAAPVQEAPRPVPPPTATQAPEPVAETRPAPAPAPAVARAREGDLVAAGTEGLVPPRITRRGTVQYPPMARMQKVEGTVITNVLVSETGAVIDVRVLRGVSRAVGLNEAAVQAMRRSTFQAGSKDGVRVKSWVTVPVEFKL